MRRNKMCLHPFKGWIFKKAFSQREKYQTGKRFPDKRGSGNGSWCLEMPRVWEEQYGQGNHRKKNLVELKLNAETWADQSLGILIPGLWPDTAHRMVLAKWLHLLAVVGTCRISCGSGIVVLVTWGCSPASAKEILLPPAQILSRIYAGYMDIWIYGGICSKLAGSPLRGTSSSHLLWGLQTGWCLFRD